MAKVALITGITGQDSTYLAEYLLKKAEVYGIKHRSLSFNTEHIDQKLAVVNVHTKLANSSRYVGLQ